MGIVSSAKYKSEVIYSMDIQEKLQNIRNEVQHLSTWDMLSITEPHTDYACKKKQVLDILNGLDEVLNAMGRLQTQGIGGYDTVSHLSKESKKILSSI